MYCSQCSQPVGAHDRVCASCGHDLLRSGGVRLTADIPGPGQVEPTPPDDWFRGGGSRHGWSAAATPAPLHPTSPPLGGPVPPPTPPQPSPAFRSAIGDPDEPFSQPTPVRRPVGVATAGVAHRDEGPAVVQPRPGRSRLAISLVTIGLLAALVPVVLVTLQLLNPPKIDLGTPAPATSAATPPAATGGASQSGAPSTTADQANGASTPAPSTPAPSTPAASTPAQSTPAPAFPVGATKCSDVVAAGPNTSCPFALNVGAAVNRTATGSFQVTADSPVTKKVYTLDCTRAELITCTGGNSAVIYVVPA